jgi:hypothetical protein
MSLNPLQVRDRIEATCVVRHAGVNPRHLKKEVLEDGTERWTLDRVGREAWTQDFQFGDSSGPLLVVDEPAVEELSWSLVSSVPARTDLMGAAYLTEIALVLAEALSMRESIGKESLELQGLLERIRLAGQIVTPFGMEKMVVPPGKLALDDADKKHLPATPCDLKAFASLLQGDWRVVTDDPNRRLMRHTEGALLLLRRGEGTKVLDTHLLEGPDALMTWAVSGFILTPETARSLLEGVQVGGTLDQAISSLKAKLKGFMNVLASVDAGGGRVLHFLLIDEDSTRRRAAILGLVVSSDKILLGTQLLQGPPGFDQMMRVLERVSLEQSGDENLKRLAQREAVVGEARLALAPFLSLDRDHRALTDALRPQPGDAAKVFLPELSTAIEAALDRVWDKGITIRPAGGQTEVSAMAGLPEDFAEKANHTRGFAQAYTPLAAYLQPGRIWISWTFHAPGEEKGRRYDALVWIDDHWAFFPKPWRLLPRH